MRILLVTLSEYLPFTLTQVLNSALDYCAIVVDEPEDAKKILANVPQLCDKVYPFYELKECVQSLYYDCVLCAISPSWHWIVREKIKKTGLSRNKFLSILLSSGSISDFWMKKVLQFYVEHYNQFELFATGISYIAKGLDPIQFKGKLINFGRSSQDLYYDYQIAKFVTKVCGGGGAY